MRSRALAALFLVAAAACSMKSPPQQPATTTMGPLDDQGKRQEITALSTQIRQWRLDASLAVEPDADSVMAMSEVSPAEAARACEAPAASGGTCGEVCDLGGAICDNAAAICRIADDLAGDGWAHDKCSSAKASCRDAEERCCTCRRSRTVGMP